MSNSVRGLPPLKQSVVAVVCICTAVGCTNTKNSEISGGQPQSEQNSVFSSASPCNDTAKIIGVAAGVILGAYLGHKVNSKAAGTVVGALAGAAVGGLIGNEIDKRQCELFKIAQRNNIQMRSDKITLGEVTAEESKTKPLTEAEQKQSLGLKVTLLDNGRQFKSGSAELTPEALAYFGQIAEQYSYNDQRAKLPKTATKQDVDALDILKAKRILLVGHTDDTGSSEQNADLSERRAQRVAQVFKMHGIPESSLFFQGAGETLPIADNRTDEGRARNRRVEIIDLANDAALRAFLNHRKPTLAYYRPHTNATPGSGGHKEAGSLTYDSVKTPVTPPAKVQDSKTASLTPVAAQGSAPPATIKEIRKQPPSKPDSAQALARVSEEPFKGIDFGGLPVGERLAQVNIGNVKAERSGFSLISSAVADESLVGTCYQDRPRVSRGVKSLSMGTEYATEDYMPGLYGGSWSDMVNGNLVALTKVAVLRDGGLPATKPTLLVYKGYGGSKDAKPDIKASPEVNVYRGDKAVLYRVFTEGSVRCMDLVIPYGTTTANDSRLYYDRSQKLYVANFNPKITK